MTEDSAYLRFPTVRGDQVAFVAEDDVWLAPLAGGRALRLTADSAPARMTAFSPDGSMIAFASGRSGPSEVHVVPVDGGPARRLTYWGDEAVRILGWTDDGRVIASSSAGEAFGDMVWGFAVPLDGGPAERLPYGPITGLAPGPGGVTVVGVDQRFRGAAAWKRYRGGTAGALWIDRDGSGQFSRLLGDLAAQLEDPGWVGDRLVLLSDHEGWGNVYSCRADGSDLRRHTDHGDAYARAMDTDGQRVVYQCLGELWLLDDLAGTPSRRLDIRLAGPRTARVPRPIDPSDAIGDIAPDHVGRGSAVEVRGTVQWLTHRDGPVRALVDQPGVRARLPRVLGGDDPASRVAWVTDADGDDAIEVATFDGAEPRRLASGQLGRVLEMTAAPDGSHLAVASHDGLVLLVDVASGEVSTADSSEHRDASGLTFSPDSRWLAWGHAGPDPLRQIRMCRVQPEGGERLVVEATTLRFSDTDPVFTPDGKYLAFLSTRTFDPVYDEQVFDMSFPAATRPYLLPLAASTPSPFDPEAGGRPVPKPDQSDGDQNEGSSAPPEVVVDVEGLDQRTVPLPVPAGRYSSLRAVKDGLLWLQRPLVGVLGSDGSRDSGDGRRPQLRRYDLRKRKLLTLAEPVDRVEVTGDGRWAVVADRSDLKVISAERRAESSSDDGELPEDIDLDRIRVQVHPSDEWRQMYAEAGRLMRDHFWTPDFAGVDWAAVLEKYRPVLERVGSRSDLSELLWEVQGELGTSHAYEVPPSEGVESTRRLGYLGADLARDDDGTWRVTRILPGDSSAPDARSPLVAPGVAMRVGDAIVAVDGRPVDPDTGPAGQLVGAAGVPVELTVVRAGEDPRQVVVEPLESERALRYQAWVAECRAAVHAASGGRVGYLHIPDMMGSGWAQLHRDLHLEMAREALVVDVRHNSGGHISELVLEKFTRSVRGWDLARHRTPRSYPENAPRGPIVGVTNQWAGSDGDIITVGLRTLGPVVGTRTWGGVTGIDGRYRLVDGTLVTQPRFAFWFDGQGWGVENYGVDPDIEVPHPPQDWAAGNDPQLDTAVRVALEALENTPVRVPPDRAGYPSRVPPTLPPVDRSGWN